MNVIIKIIDERNGSEFSYPLSPTLSDTLLGAVIQHLGYEGTEYQETFINWMINTATELKESQIRSQKAQEAKQEIENLRAELGL